ncbi:MAG: hypothetical protein M3437_09380 [Chloroflexota bacterium]|nr:hypothetical protein [Chloroflexota bacterium]MDQ5866513.1 hypothetical protein [Chloroflexota bacterium]
MDDQNEQASESQSSTTRRGRKPQATGRSRNFSLEEAFRDAIRQLPPLSGADRMDVVKVVEIRGEFGGIANLSDLLVTVRRV